jgi:SAM-dependent methyltransferase
VTVYPDRKERRQAKKPSRIAELALQVLAISAIALATVNLFLVISARSISTRVGQIAAFKPDPILSFLDQHTVAGQEIFAYPYSPMYYFLSATTNPTRYSLLIYNYNTSSQFNEAIRTLDQHKVQYVVWDTSFESGAGASFFARPASAGPLLMEPYLQSHYRLVKQEGATRILERIMEPHVHGAARALLAKEIRRVLTPGGLCCIVEHNPWNPVTRAIVRKCPVDADAELLIARNATSVLRGARFKIVSTDYFLYLPERLFNKAPSAEGILRNIPFGGQYALLARRSPNYNVR